MPNYDRVAITLPPGGTEFVVLESQVVIDFGHGQGPRGGVITLQDGRLEVRGHGGAFLRSGMQEQGGTLPAVLELSREDGSSAVHVTAHAAPGPREQAAIYLSGDEERGAHRAALLQAGGNHRDGELRLLDAAGKEVLQFVGEHSALYLGADGNEGDLIVRDGRGGERIHLSGGSGIASGGKEEDENNLLVRDSAQRQVLQFNSKNAALYLGASGNEGDLIVRDGQGKERIHLSGGSGVASGADSEDHSNCVVRDPADRKVFEFNARNAALYLGADGNEGDLVIRDAKGNESIHLDGGEGDIELLGADCAEDFRVCAADSEIEPGAVLIAANEDVLEPCASPYDRRVAGVVSGAGDLRPGIRLGRSSEASGHAPVALVGKVFCKVDAGYRAIAVGDLLTTSATPGHAMAVRDPAASAGAVLGKALRGLETGRGLIPILVCLC